MDAASERRRGDLAKLEQLCARSAGRLRIVSRDGDPPTGVTIEINYRTAGSSAYPEQSVAATRARIQLPAGYPLHPPQVYFTPPTFHPNVFSSGLVCLGSKWLPTEGLDLLVKRLVQILTFDPAVVNTASPANPTASSWYSSAVSQWRRAFPTDSISLPSDARPPAKPLWRDMSAASAAPPAAASREPAERRQRSWREIATDSPPVARRTVQCGQCAQSLRVPDVAGTQVRCPTCSHTFRVAS
ncbi:MAG TPA: ubiquitin-conjugating enzyme E2 [Vicinamibacterales bacterium]|nr:ubiquitin-conjugating enzyme E2 [Vicinamibacterales bacterium]